MDVDAAVAAALAEAHRLERGYVLAATARITRDLDTAEECVQDAYAQALTAWAASGVPAKPGAWLTTVARRRAMDVIRRNDTLRAKLPLLDGPGLDGGPDALIEAAEDVPDDRLRLIFTCCHPALAPEAQVALTLRLLCGLSTTDVARAFLVSETTMAARITRAKKKIAATRIPYRVPPAAELPERVEAVLDVVHLVFATGHTAPAGASLQRRDLAERALHLARVLHQLLPSDLGAAGLRALILLTDARRHVRTGPDGQLQLLADQDRDQWARAEIGEGIVLVRAALRRRPPSRWALMAAIAAVHAEAPRYRDTDWLEIASSTTRCSRSGPHRLSRSTAPSRSAKSTGRRPGWTPWTSSAASRSWPATTTSPPRALRSCAAWTAPTTLGSPIPKPSCSRKTRSNAISSNAGSISCELSIRARPRATDK